MQSSPREPGRRPDAIAAIWRKATDRIRVAISTAPASDDAGRLEPGRCSARPATKNRPNFEQSSLSGSDMVPPCLIGMNAASGADAQFPSTKLTLQVRVRRTSETPRSPQSCQAGQVFATAMPRPGGCGFGVSAEAPCAEVHKRLRGMCSHAADRAVRLLPSGSVTGVAAVSVSMGTCAAIA